MIKIFSPKNEAELAVTKSLLESEGIPYHVKNEHFGSLYPGIAIKYINAKTVYVPREYETDAKDLLYNIIGDTETYPPDNESSRENYKREKNSFAVWLNALIKKIWK